MNAVKDWDNLKKTEKAKFIEELEIPKTMIDIKYIKMPFHYREKIFYFLENLDIVIK